MARYLELPHNKVKIEDNEDTVSQAVLTYLFALNNYTLTGEGWKTIAGGLSHELAYIEDNCIELAWTIRNLRREACSYALENERLEQECIDLKMRIMEYERENPETAS